MSIFNKKKAQEERGSATTSECTKLLNEAFAAVDRTIIEKRAAREAAKRVQESVAQLGARLHLKKA